MRRIPTSSLLGLSLFLLSVPVFAQSAPSILPLTNDPTAKPTLISPLTQPTLSPAVIHLMELESRFQAEVEKGGGKAFASWFAEDGVTLNNGKPAVLGHRAIAETAVWDPKTYQLTWQVQGAQMGPSGDTGFTWGHYESRGTDRNGQAIVSSGRYITFWKKVSDGSWKVALDASALDAPAAGECCTLPKP